MDKKVFEGLKVLDFGWVIAGPMTLKYLADYGATVVNLESSQHPDLLRTSAPFKDNIPEIDNSGYFAYLAGNKYSVTLDLNQPKGFEIAKKLIAWADVVADSHRPGVLENWGFSYEELKKINPGVILIRNSNQGQTGPAAKQPGLGNHINGLAGIVNMVGWPGKEPISLQVAYSDYVVPHFAAAVLIGALDYRRRTGKGQALDISQLEVGLNLFAPNLINYPGVKVDESLKGNSCEYAAPHGIYRCKGDDRWCAVSVFTDEEWLAFCKAAGQLSWSKNPKFATVINRKKNESQLNELVEAWTLQQTAEDVTKLLQKAGVAAGVVENMHDLCDDPQLKERECFWTAQHEVLGNFTYLAQASRLSGTPAKLYRNAPRMGEHTEFVCREFLGMPQEEFDACLMEGVFI
jgi:benzylsuccinate CoA-transferase BbsF subunit